MTLLAHTIVVVVGIAATVILAVTHTVAADVAVPVLTTFVGYGVGAVAATKTAP